MGNDTSLHYSPAFLAFTIVWRAQWFRVRLKSRKMADRETRAWDTQEVDLVLSVLHPDIVWPWPPTPQAHDPCDWLLVWGRYHSERWSKGWQMIAQTGALEY